MRALAATRVPARVASPARAPARDGRSAAPAPARGTGATGWPAVLDVAGVLALQRTAGNAAVATALQRSALAAPTVASAKRPLLRRGSKGTDVKVLQQRLNALGTTPPLKVDGDFGKKTFDAVVAFQESHFPDDKKQWDGKVGPLTWGAIDDAYQAPEIAEDEASTGKKVVEGMDRVNAAGTADSGVWYPYNYREYHPEKYRPDMEQGLADPTYFEHNGFMDWKLKPRMSASAAIRSWLDGLTIAECYTAMIAIEYETLRAAVGNEAFDRQFGSTDEVTPGDRRLAIFPGKPVIRTKFMKKTAAAEKKDEGTAGDRPARAGDWYYFMNYPRYLFKHPGGAWQGENAICVGREGGVQKWAGMGTSNGSATNPSSHVTEAEMLASMVGAYNLDRDGDDAAALVRVTAANNGVLPPVLDPANKAYPERIGGPADILGAKPEKLNVPGLVVDETERKGGFSATAGKALDPEAVKKLREGETVE